MQPYNTLQHFYQKKNLQKTSQHFTKRLTQLYKNSTQLNTTVQRLTELHKKTESFEQKNFYKTLQYNSLQNLTKCS